MIVPVGPVVADLRRAASGVNLWLHVGPRL
jgi:hypothetical protein